MKKKLINVVLLSSFMLSACNNGSNSSESPASNKMAESTDSSKLVPNPRLTLKNKLLSGSSGTDFIDVNSSAKVGYGYDPETRQIISIPMNEQEFAYTLGNKEKSPFEDVSACMMSNYADELGSVSSTSNQSLFGGSVNGAINIGIAKASMAAEYNHEAMQDDNTLKISKLFGASVKCKMDSIVAPDLVRDKSDNFAYIQEALMKASPGLLKSIAEIRTARTLAARQTAIKEFYEKYGTYMISGVTLGQVAVRKVEMSQNLNSSSSETGAAGSAKYSSPFSSGGASFKYGNSEKFEGKGWSIKTREGFFPSDNELNTVITRLQNEFAEMQTNGIIDFSKLKPEPVEKPKIPTPELPTIEVDTETKANYSKAKTLYSELDVIPEIVDDMAIKSGSNLEKINRYNNIAENIDVVIVALNQLMDKDSALVGYLSSSTYSTLNSQYMPLVNKWKSTNIAKEYVKLAALLKEEPVDILKVDAQEQLIATKIDAAATAKAAAEAEARAQQKDDAQKVADRIKNGVTSAQYITTQFIQFYADDSDEDKAYARQYNSASRANDKEQIYNAWVANRLSKNTTKVATQEKLAQWQGEWEKRYKKPPEVEKFVTKAQADEFFKEQNAVNKATKLQGFKSTLSSSRDGYGVVDFKVTAWAKIFPELTQTFGIDDQAEQNDNIVLAMVNNYIHFYNYLSQMAKLDGGLERLRYNTQQNTYTQLNKLAININSALNNSSNEVILNNVKYDLSNTDDMNKLVEQINSLFASDPMMSSNWYTVANYLYKKGLIGLYGSFAGIKPEYPVEMNKFGLLVNPFNRIPTVAQMDANQNINPYHYSGIKIFLQKIANILKKRNNPTIEELSGVLETVHNAKGLDLMSSEYLDSYMFDNMHNVGQLALLDVPSNNQPTNLMGVIPVVLSSTTLIGDERYYEKVVNLGLMDSSGQIIGANSSTSAAGDSYNSKTLLFTMNMEKNFGSFDNPAYELILDNPSGQSRNGVTEFKLKGATNDNRSWYNKILLGVELNKNFLNVCSNSGLFVGNSVDVARYSCQATIDDGDVGYSRGYSGDSGMLDWGPLVKANPQNSYLKSTPIKYLSFSTSQSSWSMPNAQDNWYKINFPNATEGTVNQSLPIYQYKLVITPVNKEVISSMTNRLKESKQSPFLPTYNYWGL